MILLSLFISFICCFFLGSFIGVLGSIIMVGLFIFISLVVSFLYLFFFFRLDVESYSFFYRIFYWEDFIFSFSLRYDNISIIMTFIVLMVAFSTIFFSFDYMFSDPYVVSFLGLLSVFTFFMIILVLSENLILFFVGWEGIGICSFLLISFWYTRVRAVKSALLAVIVNRFSDSFLILGILGLQFDCNSLNFGFILLFSEFYSSLGSILYLYNMSCLFLLVAAVGKSAQLGLHLWLPEAMEGPTPVSSLIHAATMVTAGIFLFLKLGFLFDNSFITLWFIIFFWVYYNYSRW